MTTTSGDSTLESTRAWIDTAASHFEALPSEALASDGRDVAGLIETVTMFQTRLDELLGRLAVVADEQAEAAKVAASGTDAWLAALTGVTRRRAHDHLMLAHQMATDYPAVRVAFARGELSQDCAAIIVRTAEKIPATITAEDKAAAVESLVADAVERRLDPGRLQRVARRMLERIDPAAADAHQAAVLTEEEQHARHRAFFRMWTRHDGTWAGEFVIPELHAHLFATFLEHLTAPRQWTRNRAGEQVTDPTTGGRGYPEHLGDAFCELLEHLPTDGWSNHGRVGATVMVHLDHQHLLDGLGAAHLDTGADITASEARRLACGAGILPAVFNGGTVPVDLGRTTRLFSTGQYNALSARHDECAAEGCRRPYAWCEIHHLTPWSHGGHTDLANAVPLCGWHHRRIHDPVYLWKLLPTGEIRYRRRPPKYTMRQLATDPRLNPNLRDQPIRTPQPLVRC